MFAPSVAAGRWGPLRSAARRLCLFAALAALEIVFLTSLFDFDAPKRDFGFWQNPVVYANAAAKIAVVAFVFFLLVAWPRLQELAGAYRDAIDRSRTWLYVAASLMTFAVLLLTKHAYANAAELGLGEMWAYSALLVVLGTSLALVAAPLDFWRHLLRSLPSELAIALGGAAVAVAAGYGAMTGWDSLSSATLHLSRWFLSLYETNVLLDVEHRVLGAGDFRVEVNKACSGYEGIALILVTVAIYTWVFRRDLRFPNAILLFPVGVAAIWTLNALRIALLISIGAHLSPTVAIQGFHSAAGWVSFLLVAFAMIAVSRRVPFFAALPPRKPAAISTVAGIRPSPDPALLFLAPFIALVATSILASAFAPHDQWLYVVKVAAIGAVLWWYRDAYLPLLTGASWSSVGIGLAIGAVWIATDPDKTAGVALGAWLAALPLWMAALWLILRVFGTTVLVPIAEELAFRGYLSRVLISTRFERVPVGEFRLIAFIGSTIAFGLVHQRWVAACIAGAIYALLMYRTKRLANPIMAHAASNAAIAAWAIALQQWSLL